MATSRALRQFRETLGLAERLIAMERRYDDPPALGVQVRVRALRGGAAVLMVGAFEDYLRALVMEKVDRIMTPPAPTIPPKLWESSVFVSLEFALRGPRYGAPAGRQARLPEAVAAARRVAQGELDGQALADLGGNPGRKAVGEVFSGLGLSDVFQEVRPGFERRWGRTEAHTFVEDKLEEIINRRHAVAHRADTLSIARSDLELATRFLRVLAQELEARLRRHVADIRAGRIV